MVSTPNPSPQIKPLQALLRVSCPRSLHPAQQVTSIFALGHHFRLYLKRTQAQARSQHCSHHKIYSKLERRCKLDAADLPTSLHQRRFWSRTLWLSG